MSTEPTTTPDVEEPLEHPPVTEPEQPDDKPGPNTEEHDTLHEDDEDEDDAGR